MITISPYDPRVVCGIAFEGVIRIEDAFSLSTVKALEEQILKLKDENRRLKDRVIEAEKLLTK